MQPGHETDVRGFRPIDAFGLARRQRRTPAAAHATVEPVREFDSLAAPGSKGDRKRNGSGAAVVDPVWRPRIQINPLARLQAEHARARWNLDQIAVPAVVVAVELAQFRGAIREAPNVDLLGAANL